MAATRKRLRMSRTMASIDMPAWLHRLLRGHDVRSGGDVGGGHQLPGRLTNHIGRQRRGRRDPEEVRPVLPRLAKSSCIDRSRRLVAKAWNVSTLPGSSRSSTSAWPWNWTQGGGKNQSSRLINGTRKEMFGFSTTLRVFRSRRRLIT